MGHSLARTAFELRHRALLPRPRRIGQFPRRHQNHCRMVSAKRAFARHRNLQLRHKPRRYPRACDRALGHDSLWMARLRSSSPAPSALPGFVWWLTHYRKPAEHPKVSRAELDTHQSRSASVRSPKSPWSKIIWLSPDVGLFAGEIPHRPHLVVLSLLAAEIFRHPLSSRALTSRPAAHHRLQRVGRRQHRRRMAPRALSSSAGLSMVKARLFTMLLFACMVTPIFFASRTRFRVGRRRPSQPRRRRAPGMVRQSLHHRIRHVPQERRRRSRRHRRHGRLCRGRPLLSQRGMDPSDHSQLLVAIWNCRQRLSHRIAGASHTRTRTEEDRCPGIRVLHRKGKQGLQPLEGTRQRGRTSVNLQ